MFLVLPALGVLQLACGPSCFVLSVPFRQLPSCFVRTRLVDKAKNHVYITRIRGGTIDSNADSQWSFVGRRFLRGSARWEA